MRPSIRAAVGFAVVVLAAEPARPQPSPAAPVKSVQQVMDTVVDPSADALWAVAGTVVEHGRTTIRRPRTAKQWADAKILARRVIAGARLLQTPRPVGANGHWVLADASTPGIRTAEQIQADIARDPDRFYKAAARLQKTGEDALAALDARDIPAFLDAGARIDAACEACHAAYWYPRTPPQTFAEPDAFAKTAIRP